MTNKNKINLNRCYFHAITPLISAEIRSKYDLSKDINHIIELEILKRLRIILKTGYLAPGIEVKTIIPDAHLNNQSSSSYVYLAENYCCELDPPEGTIRNAEFSAFGEHIIGNAALVFNEHTLDDLKIAKVTHWLSEEICVNGRVPLTNLEAIVLPIKTPARLISEYLFLINTLDNDIPSLITIPRTKILSSIQNLELELDKSYNKIDSYKEILEAYNKFIPCIDYSGHEYNREEEEKWFKENKETIKQLLNRR